MAIIDAYSPAGSSSNKAVRSSWASFLVNVSVTLCAASKKASTTSEEQAVVLSAVAELLGQPLKMTMRRWQGMLWILTPPSCMSCMPVLRPAEQLE